MVRKFALSLILMFSAALSMADVITSAPGGGLWSDPYSWIGGSVPTSYDDVIIASDIQVSGTVECLGLSVSNLGSVSGVLSGPSTLVANGSTDNAGLISYDPYWFDIKVGGDLHNDGIWISRNTILTGSETRTISMSEGAVFNTKLELEAGAGGDLLSGTSLNMSGGIDLNGGRMILEVGHTLVLDACAFLDGELLANHNDLIFESWSYIGQTILDAAVLVGEVEIDWGMSFTGGVTVMDTLRNLSGAGGGAIPVSGGLVNKGLITNTNYGWSINLSGNLQNDGVIRNSGVFLDGQSEHHLSGGSEGLFDTFVFLPEFQGGTIVADTDLHFSDGVGLGGGVMILEAGSTLNFSGWGSMGTGTVYANGNTIHMDGYGSNLGDMVIDQAVLSGLVRITDPMEFTGGLVVQGILENREYFDHELSVAGMLLNEGTIRDMIHELSVIALGDVENRSDMTNALLIVDGYSDQRIGTGVGIATAEVRFDANLPAGPYQWYRDGAPLGGETSSHLSFAGLDAGDYGIYHCEGGADLSRNIIVSEHADPTAVDVPLLAARLEQNHPNPFNPSTHIAFTLPSNGHVRLTVYDATGRQVELLKDAVMEAGRHSLPWQPQDRSSGLYFYKLYFGGEVQTGKAVLLK
jgi:hypothetical protein